MNEEKITLPDELQKEMMKFFLKTSIPRKKREQQEKEKSRLLSENQNQETDRSGKNDGKNGDLC
jgi:hypothetical protein